jgi:hypothetical protein
MEQPINHRRVQRNRLTKNHRRTVSSKSKKSNASAVTNGTKVLLSLNPIAIQRRTRDLLDSLVSDLGGWDSITASELACVRMAVPALVELERRAALFHQVGEADDTALSVYCSTMNSTRRTLETLGLQRRMHTIGPSLGDILRNGIDRQRDEQPQQRGQDHAD